LVCFVDDLKRVRTLLTRKHLKPWLNEYDRAAFWGLPHLCCLAGVGKMDGAI